MSEVVSAQSRTWETGVHPGSTPRGAKGEVGAMLPGAGEGHRQPANRRTPGERPEQGGLMASEGTGPATP